MCKVTIKWCLKIKCKYPLELLVCCSRHLNSIYSQAKDTALQLVPHTAALTGPQPQQHSTQERPPGLSTEPTSPIPYASQDQTLPECLVLSCKQGSRCCFSLTMFPAFKHQAAGRTKEVPQMSRIAQHPPDNPARN